MPANEKSALRSPSCGADGVVRALLDARLGRRLTGIGHYTLRLAEELTGLAPDVVVLPAVRSHHRRTIAAAGGRPIVVPRRGDLAQLAPTVDVVHGPNFHAPALMGATRVATVHDLGFIMLPECHPPGMPERLDGIIRQALNETALYLCDSAYTRDLFMEHYGVGPARCRVVHLGVSERFSPEGPAPATILTTCLRGVRQPYLLHVGAMIKRKDLGTLLSAFELVAVEEPELELVLAGNKTRRWASEWPLVRDWLRSHPGLRRRVHILNYVPMAVLPKLYREASAVVSTSLLEGFGLTALEGLASGVPVVATAGSAIEEIAHGTAYLSPARDASSYAEGIRLALGADPIRRARGLELARRFTWRRTAELTLDGYRAAVNGERRA